MAEPDVDDDAAIPGALMYVQRRLFAGWTGDPDVEDDVDLEAGDTNEEGGDGWSRGHAHRGNNPLGSLLFHAIAGDATGGNPGGTTSAVLVSRPACIHIHIYIYMCCWPVWRDSGLGCWTPRPSPACRW